MNLYDLILLRDYNTRIVLLGVTLLGASCGLVGGFLLLRKRALVSDAIAHAALPGIVAAFIILTLLGLDARNLPALLAGAACTGGLGMAWVLAVRHSTRVKEDAAIGTVLGVFFGLGVALLRIALDVNPRQGAGLEGFIYGKTASMIASDAWLIGVAAVAVALVCVCAFKELALLCFDPAFAAAQGWPVLRLDALLMGLVVAVTVIGLQAVGLILVVAMLVIPAAAARFWTDRLPTLLALGAGFGAMSGLLGAAMSALAPRMPAGAVIVLVASGLFFLSMMFGPARGLLVRAVSAQRLSRRIALQNLLRELYESSETRPERREVGLDELQRRRSWSRWGLGRVLRRAESRGLLVESPAGGYRLSEAGQIEAERIVRNHRLWELFLLSHADIAPQQVDRDADRVEHVLSAETIRRLEGLAEARSPAPPRSPHPLDPPNSGGPA